MRFFVHTEALEVITFKKGSGRLLGEFVGGRLFFGIVEGMIEEDNIQKTDQK